MKGQITSNLIKAVLMVAGLLLFLGIYLLTANAVTSYDLPCRWSVQLSAAGLPVSLRCTIKNIELTDRQIDDDLKLKNMIAEEMANCHAKFGSGRHESVAGNNKVRWVTDFRRSLSNTLENIVQGGSSDCYPCAYIYSKGKNIVLNDYYEDYLDHTVPKGKDKTYVEIMYERTNLHTSYGSMIGKDYDTKELFIIYAENDKRNAVFLADAQFLRDTNICGGVVT